VVRYVRAMHESALVLRLPMWAARVGGLFSRPLAFNARIMQTVLGYPEEFRAAETWDDLGRPAITIEQFAARLP
jgi:hypothetical protein